MSDQGAMRQHPVAHHRSDPHGHSASHALPPPPDAAPDGGAGGGGWEHRIGVDHVNWLIKVCNIVQENPISSLRQCSSSLFVLMFQRLLGFRIPDLQLEPNNTDKKFWNIRRVLEELSDVTETDLSHILPSEIVNGNELHISLLVRVFLHLALHLLRLQEERDPIALHRDHPNGNGAPTTAGDMQQQQLAPAASAYAQQPQQQVSNSRTSGSEEQQHFRQQQQQPTLLQDENVAHYYHKQQAAAAAAAADAAYPYHHPYHRHHNPPTSNTSEDGSEPNEPVGAAELHGNYKSSPHAPRRRLLVEEISEAQRLAAQALAEVMGPVTADTTAAAPRGEATVSVAPSDDSLTFTKELVHGWKQDIVPPPKRVRGALVDPLSLVEVRHRIESIEKTMSKAAGGGHGRMPRPACHDSRNKAADGIADRLLQQRAAASFQNERRDERILAIRNRKFEEGLQAMLRREAVAMRSSSEQRLMKRFRESLELQKVRRLHQMRAIRDADGLMRKAAEALVESERHKLRLQSELFTEETARVTKRELAAVREARRSLKEKASTHAHRQQDSLSQFRASVTSWRAGSIGVLSS